MPVILPDNLPAKEILTREDPGLIIDSKAAKENIRVKVAILNLMPQKIVTETQLCRMLGKTSLPVEITLLRMGSHVPKTTPLEYLEKFYKTFNQLESQRFDGLIITGAPIENLDFEQVNYWKEMCEIFEWRKENIGSTYHICWAVQAAVYYHYGIPKYPMPEKIFGVFNHHKVNPNHELNNGFEERFLFPHSRHTEIHRDDIIHCPDLSLLTDSEEAGVFLFVSKDNRQIYVTGHPEYDPFTLKNEYERDKKKGMTIALPKNYFVDDNPENPPIYQWRETGPLLYANWLQKIVARFSG